jgi:hypothetical protein
MALELLSVLSARIVMRLNSLSLQKKFSIIRRYLYISRSSGSSVEHRRCWKMPIIAPLSSSSSIMVLLSNALSVRKATNMRSSINGGTSTAPKNLSGHQTETHEIDQDIRQRTNCRRHAAFRAAYGQALNPLLLCALDVPVNLHNRCIDHDIFRVRITR